MRATALAVAAIGVASSAFTLVAAEVGLRVLREPDRFYPYHPNSMRVFYPSEKVTPGGRRSGLVG